MDVVSFGEGGEADVLKVERRVIPTAKDDQVLIKIAVTAVTTFDIKRRMNNEQMNGLHELLGMECSGEVVAVGSNVNEHSVGDKVCALLEGGGYAEYVAVDSWRVLPIPKGIRLEEAATLPHATSVVWHALFRIGKLRKESSILVHAGAGEFGQLAIQLALLHGCTVFASSSFPEEREFCQAFGVDCIRYDESFVGSMLEKTNKRGVDLILDCMGYRVPHSLKILSRRGTLIVAAFFDVSNVCLNIGLLEKNQIKLCGFVFNYVSTEEKKKIVQEIIRHVWPMFESGKLVQRVKKHRYTFSEASAAHVAWEEYMGDRILLIPTMPPSRAGCPGPSPVKKSKNWNGPDFCFSGPDFMAWLLFLVLGVLLGHCWAKF